MTALLPTFWEADAVLSGLIVPGMAVRRRVLFLPVWFPVNGIAGITEIAEKSGGDALKVGDPGGAFRQMIQRLRRRYSLHYEMPQAKPGEERTIKVEALVGRPPPLSGRQNPSPQWLRRPGTLARFPGPCSAVLSPSFLVLWSVPWSKVPGPPSRVTKDEGPRTDRAPRAKNQGPRTRLHGNEKRSAIWGQAPFL